MSAMTHPAVNRKVAQPRLRVPYCPHCDSQQTMFLNSTGTAWQCRDSINCGHVMPVISDPAPLRFERFGTLHRAATRRLHGAAQ